MKKINPKIVRGLTGIGVNLSNHKEIYAAREWGELWKPSNFRHVLAISLRG